MKRLMGLDIGDVRIGVALTDLLQMTAQPYETIIREGKTKDLDKIQNIFQDMDVEKIIVGLPLDSHGEEGASAKKIKKFAASIEHRLSTQIVFVDERFTTVIANKILMEGEVRREKRKLSVDKLAAAEILNLYLAQKTV